MQYTCSNGTIDEVINGNLESFQGMYCYHSPNKNNVEIKFTYNAKEKSKNYRLELIYANSHKETPTSKFDKNLASKSDIWINGKQVQNDKLMIGTDVNFSRAYYYCELKKGENKIKYSLTSNTLFIGLCIKKYDVWEAHRHNTKNDKLTLINATVEHTSDFSVNTMTCEFMYHHELDELLEPTNPNANRSGFVFDYRDEINLYVRDVDGNPKQVFGGYISTVEVDSELTKLSMECADRLIDLDRRYCLSEVVIKDPKSKDDNIEYSKYDYYKNYDNYSSPIKFLLNNSELFLNTNVRVANPLVTVTTRKLAKYRDKGYTKLTGSNMRYKVNKNNITLRNGADTLKGQHLVIYDDSVNNDSVLLNTYPNLFFHYGLGVEKWEEKVEEYTTVNVETGSVKSPQKWIDRANDITSKTGDDAIKPIFTWVDNHIAYEYDWDFYQSADKTYNRKRGNCCCQAELLLTLLNAKGVTGLKYVHRKVASGRKGHVYCKVGDLILDPTYSGNGYGDYAKGYGSIRAITNYPKKPF